MYCKIFICLLLCVEVLLIPVREDNEERVSNRVARSPIPHHKFKHHGGGGLFAPHQNYYQPQPVIVQPVIVQPVAYKPVPQKPHHGGGFAGSGAYAGSSAGGYGGGAQSQSQAQSQSTSIGFGPFGASISQSQSQAQAQSQSGGRGDFFDY